MFKILKLLGRAVKPSFRATEKQLEKVAKKVPVKMTRVLTDAENGIVTLEREFHSAEGGLRKVRIETQTLKDGTKVSKTTVESEKANPIWRTKTIKREPGKSVFGGDKITIDKNYTKYWCYGENTRLTKEYNKAGILEHKDLTYQKNIGNETFINHKATQDRVYDEYPLTSSSSDMLSSPYNSKYYHHSLDGEKNYNAFMSKETKYNKVVTAKKQAEIDAVKKAEAEKVAKKLAEEKAAEELKAKQPRINVRKILNRDINELVMNEKKLADGTIERTFEDPLTKKVLVKTQDMGIGHKEWIYGSKKADMIYMTQIGKERPYIVAKKGDYTQICCDYSQNAKESERWRGRRTNAQYYYDGAKKISYTNPYGITDLSHSCEELKMPYKDMAIYKDATPEVKKLMDGSRIHEKDELARITFDSRQSYRNAGNPYKELNEVHNDAQKYLLDLEDLFTPDKV